MHLTTLAASVLVYPFISGVKGFSEGSNFRATFSKTPSPFSIDVDKTFIDETTKRVALTRFPTEVQGQPDLAEGPPVHNATTVKDYWANDYDWFEVQDALNDRLTQFTTTVDISKTSPYKEPVPLHFVHHTSPREDAIPLLFIHGWPGSFLEVGPLIERLTHPPSDSSPAFHVVAPSIPGFGFSPAPTHAGFGYIESGHAFDQLMKQLGYHKYVIQGGDAGGIIMRFQAHYHPESVVSGLNNFWVMSPSEEDRRRYLEGQSSDDEVAVTKMLDYFLTELWGYGQIHQTRPLRLAHALTDSPMGLAMWLYDGMWPAVEDIGLLTPKEIITWTMMHWIQGPYAPMRIYKEGSDTGAFNATHFHELPYVKQPMAISEFPKDLWYRTPLEWAQRSGNVKIRYLHEYGGHFPSWENPDLLAEDIWKFFGDEQMSDSWRFREEGYGATQQSNLFGQSWGWLREQLG